MEQRIFNQPNTMYRDAMDESRDGNRSFLRGQYGQRVTDNRRDFQTNNHHHVSNYSVNYLKDINQSQAKELPSSLRSFDRSATVEYPVDIYPKSTLDDTRIIYSRQTESQLRKDNRSSVQSLDSLRNCQSNDYQRNSINSDFNSVINYRRPAPEPDVRFEYRTSRDERSPERSFGIDGRGGIWRSSSERYRENINNAANFPNLFDNNLRMQLEPASPVGQDSFTTSSTMDNERSLGYRSTASSSNYNFARNGRGITNAFVRNKTNRQHTPAQGKNWFDQPYKNRTVGSGYAGASASNTFSKPFDMPRPSRNWKRKRNIPFQVRNENEKRSKIEAFSTSLQNAADAINVLMEMKSTTEVLSGSSQLGATPAKKKKKKSRNKAKAEAPSPEVKDVQNLKEMKSTAVISGTSLTTGQISEASVTQLGSTPVKKKKGKAKNTPAAVAPSPVVKDVKPVKKKQVVKDLKYLLAVVPRNHPMKKMSFEQIDLLKYAIVQEIEKLKDRNIITQPVRCYAPLRGALMVYWENDNGLECLKEVVKTLKPWDGANFKVIQRGPLNFTWTALVNKEFPNKSMTHKEVRAVFVSLVNKMDEVSDDSQPQFIESCNRRGVIMIAYTKQKDFEWLKNAIQDLQPWEGAQFRLLDVDDVPIYNKIELTLPFPVSDFDGLMARLSRQNQGLDTCDWKQFDERRKKDGRQLLVSVKDEVIEALEKIDYKPFLNLDRITVVNLGKIKNIPFSVSEFEEVLRNLKRTRTRPDNKPKLHEAPVAQTEPSERADGDTGVVE